MSVRVRHATCLLATTTPMLSILMPVYNEAATVERAIAAVLEVDLPVPAELVLVDDGSTDATPAILRGLDLPSSVSLLRHDRNRGKGAAVMTALRAARGDVAAIFDADLEYEPADLGPLLEPILDGRANAVFGIRAFDGYTSHSLAYVLGNRAVTIAANVLFNVYLHDIMTCHKVIRTDLFRSLPLREPGFAIEAEITARLLQRRERIFELPIRYRARPTEAGKKLTAWDGARVLRTLVRCRLTGSRG